MSQQSALELNIKNLKEHVLSPNVTHDVVNNITSLITKYDEINKLEEHDKNKQIDALEKEVCTFIATHKLFPVACDGGRRRKSASSSSRPRRRSSKKRGTQRKQKRRQRRGSRRA